MKVKELNHPLIEHKLAILRNKDTGTKDIANREVLILDPMLATGGSGCDAIHMIKDEGVKKIKFLCIIAAPEGVKKMQEEHPDVEIYCAKVDEKLNEIGYIVPGLGDAGDRIFGTK